MLVNQCLGETVGGHVLLVAAGGDVLGHPSLGVQPAVRAEVHVQADEDGVGVTEHLRHLEVDAGHQGAELRNLLAGEMGQVEREGRGDLFLEVRHVSVLRLRLLVNALDDRVVDKFSHSLDHLLVLPCAIGDDVLGIFPIHGRERRLHVLLVDVEQVLLVALERDVNVLGGRGLLLGQLGLGNLHGFVLLSTSSQYYAGYQYYGDK